MSKAKVCDRCGKVYPVDYDKSYNLIPIKIQHGSDYGKDTEYIEEDLCSECSNEFYRFMNMQNTNTRTDNTDHNEEEN